MMNTMADFVLPEDIMLCILTRLPVKSIVRFKCVCKPWCNLFSTPKFIKFHYDQRACNPENECFIVYSRSSRSRSLSILSIGASSDEYRSVTLGEPSHNNYSSDLFVGSCNGLVCMGEKPLILWNPVLNIHKIIDYSSTNFVVPGDVPVEYKYETFEGFIFKHAYSLGFGYDTERDDFKVVRLVVLLNNNDNLGMCIGVEVYSANSDSWETVEFGFKFKIFTPKNTLIVNGNPYWMVEIVKNQNEIVKNGRTFGWLYFDVTKMSFTFVPLLSTRCYKLSFVDWNGSLGALLCNMNEQMVESVDLCVFDSVEQIWKKNSTFGSIKINVKCLSQYSMMGKVLGKTYDEELFVYDPQTGCIKMIDIDGKKPRVLEIYSYFESLSLGICGRYGKSE